MPYSCFEDSLYLCKRTKDKDIEDRRYVITTSQMLYNVLKPNIVFLNGNSKFYDFNWDSLDGDKLCYFDFTNKVQVLDAFKEFLKEIIANGRKDIKIIVIPCIEYYVIKAFGEHNDIWNITVNMLDYKKTRVYECNLPHNDKASFERFCKAAVAYTNCSQYTETVSVNEYNIPVQDEMSLIRALPVFSRDVIPTFKFKMVSTNYILKRQFDILVEKIRSFGNIDDRLLDDIIKVFLKYEELL